MFGTKKPGGILANIFDLKRKNVVGTTASSSPNSSNGVVVIVVLVLVLTTSNSISSSSSSRSLSSCLPVEHDVMVVVVVAMRMQANTNALYWGKRLLALWEGGLPHSLDPITLETIKPTRLGGVLGAEENFLAHYRYDAERKRIIGMSTEVGPTTKVRK